MLHVSLILSLTSSHEMFLSSLHSLHSGHKLFPLLRCFFALLTSSFVNCGIFVETSSVVPSVSFPSSLFLSWTALRSISRMCL